MVMDPVSITGLVIKTLELVHKRREGKLTKEEAQSLYCRIYSSLLWEVYQNLERCNGIVRKAERGRISAGILSFFVRDALFTDFCIMCPAPEVIAGFSEIYGALERIHHWQRVTVDLESKSAGYIIGFAKDLFEARKHDKYNGLHRVLRNICRSGKQIPPVFNMLK